MNMKKWSHIITISVLGVFVIQACGPSESELQEREQARLDSLERVRVEQTRLDSIATVQRIFEEERRAAAERQIFNYTSDGSYTVQVGSWRSQTKANEMADEWKSRGFENAYTTQYGKEETGDIWFRVRLGRLATEEDAIRLQNVVTEDYDVQAWVSRLR